MPIIIFPRTRSVIFATTLLLAGAMCAAAEPGAPAPGPGADRLELNIKLPKALFQGTPKNIKPTATLETYTQKPRPPFYVPRGTTNLALQKPRATRRSRLFSRARAISCRSRSSTKNSRQGMSAAARSAGAAAALLEAGPPARRPGPGPAGRAYSRGHASRSRRAPRPPRAGTTS